MRARLVLIIATTTLGLAGCGHVSAPDEPATTTTRPAQATTAPAGTTPSIVPATVGPTTPTTVRATTTTRALSRAEATAGLCKAVAEADQRIQQGRFVSGGLRLGGGISANEKMADPAVLSAARGMLKAGLDGDAERYATLRQTASTACAKAGSPIQLSGPIMCITAPCP